MKRFNATKVEFFDCSYASVTGAQVELFAAVITVNNNFQLVIDYFGRKTLGPNRPTLDGFGDAWGFSDVLRDLEADGIKPSYACLAAGGFEDVVKANRVRLTGLTNTRQRWAAAKRALIAAFSQAEAAYAEAKAQVKEECGQNLDCFSAPELGFGADTEIGLYITLGPHHHKFNPRRGLVFEKSWGYKLEDVEQAVELLEDVDVWAILAAWENEQ